MKRIEVLIDGTWGKEDTGLDTNVAKLDSGKKIVTQAFITARATNGTVQNVHYHDGVGADGDFVTKLLGGAVGLGLKKHRGLAAPQPAVVPPAPFRQLAHPSNPHASAWRPPPAIRGLRRSQVVSNVDRDAPGFASGQEVRR